MSSSGELDHFKGLGIRSLSDQPRLGDTRHYEEKLLIGWTWSRPFFVPLLFYSLVYWFLSLFITILSSASALATESYTEFVNAVSVDGDQRYHYLIDIRDLI